MKTLKCIIVDDEPLAVSLLESFVTRTSGLELVASYTDSVEFATALREKHADLLFLDIQMPDMNGMELARMVPPGMKIVFTTAFKDYALESYEVSAIDYLLKPIRYNKFIAAVEKVRMWFERQVENSSNTFFIKVDGMLKQFPVSDVIYVCGMKDYVAFYMEGERRPLVTHLTMKAVEGMLPASKFMRIHRSYIVALDKIRSVDRNLCVYMGDEIIHVTDAYSDEFTRFVNSRFPVK